MHPLWGSALRSSRDPGNSTGHPTVPTPRPRVQLWGSRQHRLRNTSVEQDKRWLNASQSTGTDAGRPGFESWCRPVKAVCRWRSVGTWAYVSSAIEGEREQHLPLRASAKTSSFPDRACSSPVSVSIGGLHTHLGQDEGSGKASGAKVTDAGKKRRHVSVLPGDSRSPGAGLWKQSCGVGVTGQKWPRHGEEWRGGEKTGGGGSHGIRLGGHSHRLGGHSHH